MDFTFKYVVENYWYVPAYQKGGWDGNKRFLRRNSLPYPFINKVEELIEAYNRRMGTSYELSIIDERDSRVVNKKYETNFMDNEVNLRPYQEEAVEKALQEKIGILAMGTGAGKTVVSAEIIKRINQRTLFLCNRTEIIRQTRDVYEDYLGIPVGYMAEGFIDTKKQVTVSSIQTLYAILNREDKTSEELKKYLYNVNVVIGDESQTISDSGMYGVLAEEMKNTSYVIGLSGSPWRNQGDTLEMNSFCGFPIYEKSTEELEREGYLVRTPVYFIDFQGDSRDLQDFHLNYDHHIVENEERNSFIRKAAEIFRDRKVIILVNRINHGEILQGMIPNSFFLNGSTPKEQRKEKFEEFKKSKDMVLISMVKLLGMGIDIPDLQVMINASAFGSSIDTVQTIGRVKRKAKGKDEGIFIDFTDNANMFRGMAKKRARILRDFGNEDEYSQEP